MAEGSYEHLGDFDVITSVRGFVLMRVPAFTVKEALAIVIAGTGKNLVGGHKEIDSLQNLNGTNVHEHVDATAMLARLIDLPGRNVFFLGAADNKAAPFITNTRTLEHRPLAMPWDSNTDFALMTGDPNGKKKVAPPQSSDTSIGSGESLMVPWKDEVLKARKK